MQINWCLKGIMETETFINSHAAAVLSAFISRQNIAVQNGPLSAVPQKRAFAIRLASASVRPRWR